MGYFIDGIDIADETISPAKVSLSGNPNYIQFESKKTTEGKPVEIELEVKGNGWKSYIAGQIGQFYVDFENITTFSIIEERTGLVHKITGTDDINKVDNNTFYMGEKPVFDTSQLPIPEPPDWGKWHPYQTAESLKNTLKKNTFLGSKFDITLPQVKDGDEYKDGNVIYIKSKGCGKDYAFTISYPNQDVFNNNFFKENGDPLNTHSNDTIGMDYDTTEIHLDLYKDTKIFLGQDDTPNDENMGTHAITLTKSYSYTPIWFNVNILESNDIPTTFLTAEDWVETGTIRDFRFTASRVIAGKNSSGSSLFYNSPVLYSVAGYKRTLEENDLTEHVFDTKEILKNPDEIKKVKPLTNQPTFFHIKGQTQFFNFILSDANHKKTFAKDCQFGICYELLSQSGRAEAKIYKHLQARNSFYMVNTIKLDIDSLLKQYPKTGKVNVSLIYSYPDEEPVQISKEVTFNILPDCLHKVKDFAFLNRLGGWSSFNFSGLEQTDFKADANTIFKTQRPGFTISSEIESVYSKNITEKFSVQTMPVSRLVCDWLKELAASKKVYELSAEDKRYIIVEELNIKPNSKDELFRVEMKYRYSDEYN